jgi:hypothetical protein
VIARNSSFSYKGKAVDVKQVGRELGVRYVLEGSVRKVGNRVRITGQLIDAAAATHLWADRFDGSLEDIFDLQDKVASSVAGIIEPALQAAETARSADRPTNDLTAYDLYLRAYAMVLSSARQAPVALRLMEEAIARDPRYGPALAWAEVCCFRLVQDGRSEDDLATDRRKSVDFARRALEVAGDDPGILVNAALPLAYFGEDIGTMMALVDPPGVPVRERSAAVAGQVSEQIFETVLPRKRVSFQVEKDVALGRLGQPGKPKTRFHGKQLKSQLAGLPRLHLKAGLFANAGIGRGRPALGFPIQWQGHVGQRLHCREAAIR